MVYYRLHGGSNEYYIWNNDCTAGVHWHPFVLVYDKQDDCDRSWKFGIEVYPWPRSVQPECLFIRCGSAYLRINLYRKGSWRVGGAA